MDIAYRIAQYLVNAGYGTLGTSIFVDQMPAEQDGITVVRSGGDMNNYIPIEQAILDIYIKDASSSTAITNLESMKRYLHRMHTTEVSNASIYTILVLGDIEPVVRDAEYNKIYKLTIQVTFRNSDLIS